MAKRADYDGWRQLGLEELELGRRAARFLKHEDHIAPPNEFHRAGGEWRVEHPRVRWDILDAVREACAAAGIPKTDDFNTGDNEGSSYFQVNQKRGRRWSAARAFLKPVLTRPNLRLETGIQVERVVLDGSRAAGVAFRRAASRYAAEAAGEVILAGGAIGSPHLLELSGVGDAERLQALGRESHATSGVGENLQDHCNCGRSTRSRACAPSTTITPNLETRRDGAGVRVSAQRSADDGAVAARRLRALLARLCHGEPEFHFQPLSLDKWGEGLHPFGAFTASVCNLRPTSRGGTHAQSPDPAKPPLIRPNYLSTEEDRRVAVDALRLTRRIVGQPPLAPYKPEEYKPGGRLTSDAELVQAAGDIGTTIFHPVGTARMGRTTIPSPCSTDACGCAGSSACA